MGGRAHQLLSLQHALQKVHFAGVLADHFGGRFTERRQQEKLSLLPWRRGRRHLGAPTTLTLLGLSEPAACLPGHPHTGGKAGVSQASAPRQEQTRERGGARRGAREGRGMGDVTERAWPARGAVGRETRTSGVYALGPRRRRPEGAGTVAWELDHRLLGPQASTAAWDSLTFSRRHSSGSRFSAAIDSQRQSSRTRFNSSRDVGRGR